MFRISRWLNRSNVLLVCLPPETFNWSSHFSVHDQFHFPPDCLFFTERRYFWLHSRAPIPGLSSTAHSQIGVMEPPNEITWFIVFLDSLCNEIIIHGLACQWKIGFIVSLPKLIQWTYSTPLTETPNRSVCALLEFENSYFLFNRGFSCFSFLAPASTSTAWLSEGKHISNTSMKFVLREAARREFEQLSRRGREKGV